jgi:hypothetical protein
MIAVNIAMKVWVPQKTKNILASWRLLASLYKNSFVCCLVRYLIHLFIHSFYSQPASQSVSWLDV